MIKDARYYDANYPEYSKCMKRRTYMKKQLEIFQSKLDIVEECEVLLVQAKIAHYIGKIDKLDKELESYRLLYGITAQKK